MNQNKTATSEYKGTNQLLIGIVLSVITFTLFAQTTLNIAPTMRADLGINMTSSNLAVSITSLFSGMFIVVMGGISDRLGRVRIIRVGLLLSTIGSALIALSPTGTAAFLIPGRIIQGLSAACIMPSTLALIKTYYQGPDRQRAISYYSMGAWGGFRVDVAVWRISCYHHWLALDLLDIHRCRHPEFFIYPGHTGKPANLCQESSRL